MMEDEREEKSDVESEQALRCQKSAGFHPAYRPTPVVTACSPAVRGECPGNAWHFKGSRSWTMSFLEWVWLFLV